MNPHPSSHGGQASGCTRNKKRPVNVLETPATRHASSHNSSVLIQLLGGSERLSDGGGSSSVHAPITSQESPICYPLKIRFQKGQQDLLCYTHSRTEPPACISGSMICEWYTSLGARKMRKSLELWKNLGLLKDAPKNCSNPVSMVVDGSPA